MAGNYTPQSMSDAFAAAQGGMGHWAAPPPQHSAYSAAGDFSSAADCWDAQGAGSQGQLPGGCYNSNSCSGGVGGGPGGAAAGSIPFSKPRPVEYQPYGLKVRHESLLSWLLSLAQAMARVVPHDTVG
jgi:hypothetical protein